MSETALVARPLAEAAENEQLPATRGPADLIEAARSVSIEDLKRTLAHMQQLKGVLDAFIKDYMEPGIDWGPPFPHSKKNVLLKPGAEKLLKLFGYVARPVMTERTEVNLHADPPFISYVFRTEVIDRHGRIIAYGDGTANSLEPKYAYRTSKRTCPKCEGETLIRSNRNGPHWWCGERDGGCGENFDINDPLIVKQEIGQVQNEDVGGLEHTIMRIAKKRSMLDATQIATGTSGIFDLDLEYEDKDARRAERADKAKAAAPAANGGEKRTTAPAGAALDDIGEAGRKQLWGVAYTSGHTVNDVRKWIQEAHGLDISKPGFPKAKLPEILKRLGDKAPLFPLATAAAAATAPKAAAAKCLCPDENSHFWDCPQNPDAK